MSTRCKIFVKIKEPCTLIFNSNLLDNHLNNLKETLQWVHPIEINPSDKYIGIYCHMDGYPEGAGTSLKKYFNTYEKALNLMALGAITNLDDTFEAFNDTEPVTVSYIQINDPLSIEYAYLFKDRDWYVTKSPHTFANTPVYLDENVFKKF